MFRWLNEGRGPAQLSLFGQACRFSLPRQPSLTLPCVTTIDDDEGTQAAELARVFDAMRGQAGRRVPGLGIRLGGALVYQDAARVDAASLSRDALRSVLSAHWHATLGDAHGPLAVSYSVQPGARSVVTSCTGEALVQRIRGAASAQGFRVASITPSSAGIWNAHRRSIPDRRGYLLVCEQDFITIGAYEDGTWSAWGGEAREGGEWRDLARSVQRFARCRGIDDAWPVWVAGVAPHSDPAAAGFGHWKVLDITPAAPTGRTMHIPWLGGGRPLELDFLRPGASTARRPAQLALLAGSIPLLAMAVAGYEQEARAVHEELDALELAQPRPQPRAAKARSSSAQSRSRAASAAQVTAIQAELNYPWQSFLTLLESERQDDVALLALEPDRRNGLTRISAEARNMTAMLNYLAELQKSEAFDDVVLASHELETRRPGTPIRFELQAHWRAGFRLARHPQPDTAPRPQPLAAVAKAAEAEAPSPAVPTTAESH